MTDPLYPIFSSVKLGFDNSDNLAIVATEPSAKVGVVVGGIVPTSQLSLLSGLISVSSLVRGLPKEPQLVLTFTLKPALGSN